MDLFSDDIIPLADTMKKIEEDEINNKKEFDSLLYEYVLKALKFYDDTNFQDVILNDKLYEKNKCLLYSSYPGADGTGYGIMQGNR